MAVGEAVEIGLKRWATREEIGKLALAIEKFELRPKAVEVTDCESRAAQFVPSSEVDPPC